MLEKLRKRSFREWRKKTDNVSGILKRWRPRQAMLFFLPHQIDSCRQDSVSVLVVRPSTTKVLFGHRHQQASSSPSPSSMSSHSRAWSCTLPLPLPIPSVLRLAPSLSHQRSTTKRGFLASRASTPMPCWSRRSVPCSRPKAATRASARATRANLAQRVADPLPRLLPRLRWPPLCRFHPLSCLLLVPLLCRLRLCRSLEVLPEWLCHRTVSFLRQSGSALCLLLPWSSRCPLRSLWRSRDWAGCALRCGHIAGQIGNRTDFKTTLLCELLLNAKWIEHVFSSRY